MSIDARLLIIAVPVFLVASPALAYVGPGAGLSLLAAFWALVTAVVSSLAFLVIWPLRHRLRRRRNAAQSQPSTSAQQNQAQTGSKDPS